MFRAATLPEKANFSLERKYIFRVLDIVLATSAECDGGSLLYFLYPTVSLCHLPVSDVDGPVFGHREGKRGHVASAEHPGYVGAHILWAGDEGQLMSDGANC